MIGAWPANPDGTFPTPSTAEEWDRFLSDANARIHSGLLYRIISKGGDGEANVVPFVPNAIQRRLIASLWHRSVVCKARQLGCTTLFSILLLDHALFASDQRCGIVAHDRESAETIFRDKIRFAYLNLPAALRERMPLAREAAAELLFAHNNSSIRVATSMRSGTINRLLISEFGKICAKFPDKAVEVMTGSIPAVPLDGMSIIESTAEGQGGHFYEIVQRAKAAQEQGRPLSPRDWRLHFFPWHEAEEYRLSDPERVAIAPADHAYFDRVEAETNTRLTLEQRAWYVATRQSDYGGDPNLMGREYPSTIEEPFATSNEGCFYSIQLTAARREGRIGKIPIVDSYPVHSFWDLGNSDGTAIWLMQKVGAEFRFIDFIEAQGEPYSYYVKELQKRGHVWGTHYLPHDATHKRQQGTRNLSPVEMVQELAPGWHFEIVPRIDEVIHGIQMVRAKFSQAWFDEERCREGLKHLAAYSKEWSDRLAVWTDRPRHDEHSHGSDAFRMWAEGWQDHAVSAGVRPKRRNTSGLVV